MDENNNVTLQKDEENNNKGIKNKFNLFLKTKKGKAILFALVVVFILGGIVLSQYPTSAEKAYEEYSSISDYDLANKWLEEKFDGKGLFGEKEMVRKAQVLMLSLKEMDKNFINTYGGNFEDINNVKIEKVFVEDYGGSYSSYDTIGITIKNNSSKNISYVKVDLFIKDSSGNIINSDWTNDSSTIRPGATQTLTKMIKKGYDDISAEISDIRFQ